MPQLTLDQVRSVYVGKPNECMCGCSGKYTYTSVNQVEAGKNRGYEVKHDEVDDKRVERVIAKIGKNIENGMEVLSDDDAYILTVLIGKTQYTIYTR